MTPEIIAHGANTREKALGAISKGLSPEIDVTKGFLDKKIIIQHNGILGAIGIGQKLEEFSDILTLADNSPIPIIDLQHPHGKDFVPRLSSCIGNKRVIICGTEHQIVSDLCSMEPDSRLPLYSIGKPKHLEEYFQRQEGLMPPLGFSVRHNLINPELLKKLRNGNSTGARIYAWTVNSLQRAEELAEMGIDGIFPGYPQLLQKALFKP